MPMHQVVAQGLNQDERDALAEEVPNQMGEMKELVQEMNNLSDGHRHLAVILASVCFLVQQASDDATARKTITSLLAETLFNPDYIPHQNAVTAKLQQMIAEGLDPDDITPQLVKEISDEMRGSDENPEKGQTLQ